MSFYNTGNPVPSIDPRDLDDNAKHIDELTNSTFPTFVDRLGTTRKTLAGIEADADAATLRGDLADDGGPDLLGFSQSETYAAGTLGAHVKASVVVTDHPYNASSVGDATAAFQAAYDASPAGGRIVVPAPGPFTVGAVTGTKAVTWEIQYDINGNLGLLSLPGVVVGILGVSETTYRSKGLGSDFAVRRFDRIANYVGGTPGNVCSNLRAYTNVTSNASTSFEWVGTFVMDNAGQGENVAVYGQGNRRAASAVTLGGTFGGVFEARDFTQEVNPTSGLIGLEVDIFANGTDSVGRRIGIDLVSGKGVSGGSTSEAYAGIRIGPQGGDASSSRFRNVILISGDKDVGISISGTATGRGIDISNTGGTKGVVVGGTNSVSDFSSAGTTSIGFLFEGTYSSGLALRMATGVGIGLEATGAIKIQHGANAIQLNNGATINNSFSIINGAMSIGANQVVGPRDTGWTAMTGAVNKATVYDVATVTLPQLAARVAAIQASLTTHGLIGV